jgi:ribosomal protein L28
MNHLITSINLNFMPKCEICAKGSQKAANRSHSKVKTLRRQNPNLQKLDKHMVCTKCRRTITKKLTEMATA